MNNTETCDLIIIGGGPAGLASAIYASRGGLKTFLLDSSTIGGQPSFYLETSPKLLVVRAPG